MLGNSQSPVTPGTRIHCHFWPLWAFSHNCTCTHTKQYTQTHKIKHKNKYRKPSEHIKMFKMFSHEVYANQNYFERVGIVTHNFNPSTFKIDTGESWIQGQPGKQRLLKYLPSQLGWGGEAPKKWACIYPRCRSRVCRQKSSSLNLRRGCLNSFLLKTAVCLVLCSVLLGNRTELDYAKASFLIEECLSFFTVAVTKYPDQNDLRKEGLVVANSSRHTPSS